MDKAQLQAIRERIERSTDSYDAPLGEAWEVVADDAPALIDEVERLRTLVAALAPAVEPAVQERVVGSTLSTYCFWCDAEVLEESTAHKADCPYQQARRYLEGAGVLAATL